MEMIITLSKKEENAVLNIASDMLEKRVCITESTSYEGKWGVIQITPTETEFIVNAHFEPNCVIDCIEMATDLFRDVKVWAVKYAEGLMSFSDKWADKLSRKEETEVEEENN